jgi:hypothetical protein
MDFEQWKKETQNYSADFKKDFIGKKRYRETLDEIIIQIKNILKVCEKTPDNFNAIDINSVFKHLYDIDFNDSYYIELAKLGNWKIVTDDRDFISYKDHNVDIITFHK